MQFSLYRPERYKAGTDQQLFARGPHEFTGFMGNFARQNATVSKQNAQQATGAGVSGGEPDAQQNSGQAGQGQGQQTQPPPSTSQSPTQQAPTPPPTFQQPLPSQGFQQTGSGAHGYHPQARNSTGIPGLASFQMNPQKTAGVQRRRAQSHVGYGKGQLGASGKIVKTAALQDKFMRERDNFIEKGISLEEAELKAAKVVFKIIGERPDLAKEILGIAQPDTTNKWGEPQKVSPPEITALRGQDPGDAKLHAKWKHPGAYLGEGQANVTPRNTFDEKQQAFDRLMDAYNSPGKYNELPYVDGGVVDSTGQRVPEGPLQEHQYQEPFEDWRDLDIEPYTPESGQARPASYEEVDALIQQLLDDDDLSDSDLGTLEHLIRLADQAGVRDNW